MEKLNVELCPETGICSIVKGDGTKIDLMPDEVEGVRQAGGDAESIRKILADVDPNFAEKLEGKELDQLSSDLG